MTNMTSLKRLTLTGLCAALPGILCHLVVTPILVMTLHKARTICLD